jgi:hypothetical protein
MLRRYLSLTIGMLFFGLASVVAPSIANTKTDPADLTHIQQPHDLVEQVTQELLKTIEKVLLKTQRAFLENSMYC